MYFGTKSYLKSNRNHTAKHTLSWVVKFWPLINCGSGKCPILFKETAAASERVDPP